jgi:hypothetical protein
VRIFFDQGTPAPLRFCLHDHSVDTAAEKGWSELSNGDLLRVIEEAGYDLLITTDQNLRHQQTIAGRAFGILVLTSTSWPRIRLKLDDIVRAVESSSPGGYMEVPI